jgi:hypothetical protein
VVKADEIAARLKSARQDALRALRDRLDLYEDGDSLIKLGRHRFTVNTQPLELTLVPRDGDMALHLSGTDYYETITDAAFLQTRPYWAQDLISETEEVYRGEFLAASLFFAAEAGAGGLSVARLLDDTRGEGGLLARVRAHAQERYDEGYERGVHDADAALILEKLLDMQATAGLLRYAAVPRGLAVLFWVTCRDDRDDMDLALKVEIWQRQIDRGDAEAVALAATGVF